jgi:broad specificity phosphatase PhoE
MKPLILVKHSLPEIVEDIPARAWTLSEEGRERARKLAELLFPYKPEILLSSVEPKAQETAWILGKELGLSVQSSDGLHEHDRSTSLYYTKGEFARRVQEFIEKPDMLAFGNETANQALTRFREAVEMALKVHKDKIVVIVSHGTVISLFVSWLTGSNGFSIWQTLGLPSFVALDMESRTLLKTENLL